MLAPPPEELLRRVYPTLNDLVEAVNEPLKSQPTASCPALSMRRLKYLTVNLRRLPRVNAVNEEVVNRVAAVVDNEVDEGGLRRVKMQMFRPPT